MSSAVLKKVKKNDIEKTEKSPEFLTVSSIRSNRKDAGKLSIYLTGSA